MSAELKTKKTNDSVDDFINTIANESQKIDSRTLVELMKKVSKNDPKMWGKSIIGFGKEHLKYASGRDLDWFRLGFSPRKKALTLYVLSGDHSKFTDLLGKLGKHSHGGGCLYINNLKDIDMKVLEEIFVRSFKTGHTKVLE